MQCLQCHQNTDNPKFCSRSCAAKYNNKKYPKRTHKKIRCKTCGSLFRHVNKKVFCSPDCKKKAFDLIVEERVKTTGTYYPANYKSSNKAIRKYLVRKYGNRCMICGQDGENWNNKSLTLIVDHINGHADDWRVENIRLICPNCDSQLPTYKGRNKGNSTRSYFILSHKNSRRWRNRTSQSDH